ncbi:MAG: antirestriction protein ArdA [Coriobacteriaceae bacterium]|nr:antirestriction protein ArdA [Coriobacteriaceae bacterium]MCI6844087.1 antirestriction protein ArdA [Coriobacteriaceae bacterium]MDD7585300.1 antirestriction protein ArdA [Coriobacteriaceae bacterium]
MMAHGQFAAFAANLGRYNEGDMVGGWLPLPYDPDGLDGWLRQHALVDAEGPGVGGDGHD